MLGPKDYNKWDEPERLQSVIKDHIKVRDDLLAQSRGIKKTDHPQDRLREMVKT